MGTLLDIRGFAFDLDGILTDTAGFHSQAWQQIAAKLDIPWTQALAADLKGRSRQDALAQLLAAGGLTDQLTAPQKMALSRSKNETYLRLIQTLDQSAILPGMLSLLTELTQAGYPLVLASASTNAPLILDRLNLTGFFQALVDPKKAVRGKPAPDIYWQAADLLGITPPQLAGIEDAQTGVAAIKAAGSFAIGVGSAVVLAKADRVVPQTADLTYAKIKQWLQ